MPYMLHAFRLQLFAEDGGGETAAVADTSAVVTADTGAQDPAGAEAQQTASADGEGQPPEESWDSLIKGKYKKEYSKSVRDAVNKRFRNQSDLQGKVNAIDPMVQALAKRYGIAPAEDGGIPIDALTRAVMNDDQALQKEAFDRGMSIEDLRHMHDMERQNAYYKSQAQQAEQQREWDAIQSQGEQLKQLYPDFDLDTEMGDAQFGHMVATLQSSGFPNALQIAYEAVHRDEIMSGAMGYAVKRTQQKMSNAIQSGMKRPAENGAGGQQAGAATGVDPSKLTLKQIEDIKMRAQSGERITF